MAVFRLSIISVLAIGVVMTEKQRKNSIQECRPGSSCYKFIDKEDIWTSAVQYCELRDWQLVEIETFEELLFLQDKILRHFGKHAEQVIEFWTAGYYNKTLTDWMWYPSHQRIQFISWRNGVQVSMWAPPEPNSRHTEDCIGLFNREDYYMNDDDCFIKRFFICEVKCTCGNRSSNETVEECRCCKEIIVILDKTEELNVDCIIDHPGIQTVCLDEYVLEAACYAYRQQIVLTIVMAPISASMMVLGIS